MPEVMEMMTNALKSHNDDIIIRRDNNIKLVLRV